MELLHLLGKRCKSWNWSVKAATNAHFSNVRVDINLKNEPGHVSNANKNILQGYAAVLGLLDLESCLSKALPVCTSHLIFTLWSMIPDDVRIALKQEQIDFISCFYFSDGGIKIELRGRK